jgi:hypothetical protein
MEDMWVLELRKVAGAGEVGQQAGSKGEGVP